MTNQLSSGSDNQEESGELLDDLESIKDLLDEDQDSPLLDDVEQPAPTLGIPAPPGERQPAAISNLLGDAWGESVQQMFADARQTIEAHSEQWLPEQTDELSQALKIRLDATVHEWLTQTLAANIELLRDRIVMELADEIAKHIDNNTREKQNLT